MSRLPWSRVTALLLIAAAVLFVIGVAAERAVGEDEEAHADEVVAPQAAEADEHDESDEAGNVERESEGAEVGEPDEAEEERNEAGEAREAGEAAESGETHADEDEAILGIDPEATWTVTIAVTISLLLAAAIWLFGARSALVGVAAFGVLFALLDVREVLHQLDESRAGLAALVMVVALLHVGAATAAGLALRGSAPAAVDAAIT
jgi:hypothetical protein